MVGHVQNHKKPEQISSANCRPRPANHFPVSTGAFACSQSFTNHSTKTADQDTAMNYVVPIIALIAFIISLKAWHVQNIVLKEVRKHIAESNGEGR